MSHSQEATHTTSVPERFRYECYLTDGSSECGSHRHNFLEFVFILDGDCDVSLSPPKQSTLRKGAFLLLSSADYHEFFCEPGRYCQLYVAHVDGYLLSPTILTKFIQSTGSLLFCQEDSEYQLIKAEFDLMRSEIDRDPNTPERDSMIINIVSRLCHMAYRIVCEQSAQAEGTPTVLRSALIYINNYFQHPLSLDEVAAHVGLSRFQFSKLFHKHLHVTFQTHLLEKRLQWAYYALQWANCSVAEVAEQAGFHSRSYFCNKFKERFGVTPGELKRAVPDAP